MLTSHHWGPVMFIWGQFRLWYHSHQSLKLAWKLFFLILYWNLPGANELNILDDESYFIDNTQLSVEMGSLCNKEIYSSSAMPSPWYNKSTGHVAQGPGLPSSCPLWALIHGGHSGPLVVGVLWISPMDIRLLGGLQWPGGMGWVPGWWLRGGSLCGVPYHCLYDQWVTAMCAMSSSLTHLGLNKMTTLCAIFLNKLPDSKFQIELTNENCYSSASYFESWSNWKEYHWFGWWLGTEEATSHYPNQKWQKLPFLSPLPWMFLGAPIEIQWGSRRYPGRTRQAGVIGCHMMLPGQTC